jgi:signal transduction histidine kinase
LQREKEAAEHATIAKSHFLAAASHDLRQPLHALGLFVSALAQSDAARREPELVSNIQSGVNTLQNLLDAILDISRLDGGNLVPEIERFPLGPVLNRAADDVALLAKDKGLRLRVRPTGAWVRSDRKIVERILLNLIGNALRYTRTGGVLVSCRQRKDVVLVEVWDTGTGIPEHARQEIFEEYVQLDNVERDSAKGLGLGLAICRRLAELLCVPLGVRSRPGRGSVFWIQLPVVPPASADESVAIEASASRRSACRERCWWSTVTPWCGPECSRRSPAGAFACCSPPIARKRCAAAAARSRHRTSRYAIFAFPVACPALPWPRNCSGNSAAVAHC